MKSRKNPEVESWRDAISLIISYVKQETVTPLKGIGRFIAFGLVATTCFAVASLFFVLALLRALQTETGRHFTGSLDWAPYLLTFILSAFIAAISVSAVFSAKRSHNRARKSAT